MARTLGATAFHQCRHEVESTYTLHPHAASASHPDEWDAVRQRSPQHQSSPQDHVIIRFDEGVCGTEVRRDLAAQRRSVDEQANSFFEGDSRDGHPQDRYARDR